MRRRGRGVRRECVSERCRWVERTGCVRSCFCRVVYAGLKHLLFVFKCHPSAGFVPFFCPLAITVACDLQSLLSCFFNKFMRGVTTFQTRTHERSVEDTCVHYPRLIIFPAQFHRKCRGKNQAATCREAF